MMYVCELYSCEQERQVFECFKGYTAQQNTTVIATDVIGPKVTPHCDKREILVP
jgi:hypothetical protein